MPAFRTLILSAGLALLLLAPPGAVAVAPAALPPTAATLVAAQAGARDCAAGLTGRPGTARTTWTAPMSGFLSARLAARRGDWDLALFDARSRRPVASSAGFRGRELAQVWVTGGQRLVVQGCRQPGASRSARSSLRLLDVAPPAAAKPSLVRLERPSPEALAWLERAGFDVTHNMRAHYADVVVPDASKLATLKRSGLPFTTRVRDLTRSYARARQADVRYAAAVGDSSLPTGRTGYRRYEDYQAELKEIADATGPYATIARPVVIGRSFQGREIQGVELAADVRAKDDGRPVYLVVAAHHAREWPSAEVAMEFAWMLAKGYGQDSEITRLLQRERVVVVPLINPDGFFASRAAASDGMFPDPADTTGAPYGDTVEGVLLPFGGNLAYRRKNCNGPVPGLGGAERDYPCYYQWGVDPNRNYGEGWGGPGASPDPNTQTYRGAGQWSEPETQAVHAFSQQHPVTSLITLHNVAALVLRPPGRGTDGKAPDEDRMRKLGDAMAAVTGYESQYSFQLYDTSGTTEDWNYAAAGTYGYTIEIGPKNGKFHMPYQTGVVNEWIGPPVDATKPDGPRKGGLREALLIGARSAADPTDHSVLTGSAPPRRVLRLRKEFETKSGEVCTYAQGSVRAGTVPALDCVAPGSVRSQPDHLEYKTVVPASGEFEWHVTPSTRPFTGGKYVEGEKVQRTETFRGPGAPPAAGNVEREFEVTEADVAKELDLKLQWPVTPEDYDLYLWYVNGDGSRTPIGTGWLVDGLLYWPAPGRGVNYPGLPEHVTVTNPPVGRYVAEIRSPAAVAHNWTLTVERTGQHAGHGESTGVTEAWTLTCESPRGKVFGERKVTVARGERVAVGNPCAPKAGPGKAGSGKGHDEK